MEVIYSWNDRASQAVKERADAAEQQNTHTSSCHKWFRGFNIHTSYLAFWEAIVTKPRCGKRKGGDFGDFFYRHIVLFHLNEWCVTMFRGGILPPAIETCHFHSIPEKTENVSCVIRKTLKMKCTFCSAIHYITISDIVFVIKYQQNVICPLWRMIHLFFLYILQPREGWTSFNVLQC